MNEEQIPEQKISQEFSIEEHNILVKRTARYYSSGIINEKTKTIWFVLHGFAQLAKDFISEFEFLSKKNDYVIAPEGLSRSNFGRASDSRIGASWMTKEDRLNEIDDYVEYLDTLYKEIFKNLSLGYKVNVLGFSQGGSTALRWFINGTSSINNLFICSSDIAKDVDISVLRKKSIESKIFYIYGSKDTSYSNKNFNDSVNFLNENKINFIEKTFEGGHEINSALLKELSVD